VHLYSAFKSQGIKWAACYKEDLVIRIEVKGMPVDCCKQLTNAVQENGKLHVDRR
jgi:hypothetical protein